MADIAAIRFVIRNTFLELVADDVASHLPRLRRSYSDHRIEHKLLSNAGHSRSDSGDCSTTTDTSGSGSAAGTSGSGSEVGSDDVGSWAEVAFGPPGTFVAPSTSTLSCTASCQPHSAAGHRIRGRDCKLASEEDCTTVIVKQMPLHMPRSALLATLDSQGFASLYIFVYLPVNFRKGVSLG